jgi:hypothetical protein
VIISVAFFGWRRWIAHEARVSHVLPEQHTHRP